jgi:microcompartment protein CcmL/EutN
MGSLAIGLLEFKSIAKGIEAADAMVKAAYVQIKTCQPVCPGKFVVIVAGEIGPVKSALASGREIAKSSLVDEIIIPNVHKQVFPAMAGITDVREIDAVGIMETFTVASSVIAADIVCKTSEVELLEVRLAKGLGGKSYIVFTGTVEDCKAALEKAGSEISKEGLLIEKVLIPRPGKDIFNFLI